MLLYFRPGTTQSSARVCEPQGRTQEKRETIPDPGTAAL